MPPFWSVMIPTFNRECVERALRSVLAQDPGPEKMHIAVVDNRSTKADIEAIVRHVGGGGGRVEFHRNAENVGGVENWNRCIDRARGQWVHLLHDDDFVHPGFYEVMEAAAHSTPPVAAAFCATHFVDHTGREIAAARAEQPAPGIFHDLMPRLLKGNAIQFVGMVVRRDIYRQVGRFDPALDYAADWDMWMRIASRFPVWYDPRSLAAYTQHLQSGTAALLRSARDRRGFTLAVDRWLAHAGDTPENRARAVAQKEVFAHESLLIAAQSFAKNDFWAGFNQLHAAIDCSTAPPVLQKAKLYLSYILNRAPITPDQRRELLALIPQDSPAATAPATAETWQKVLKFLAKIAPP